MIFWKRFYIVRETKRLMSTLPITKTPVSYLYFQIERIDFYRMKYRFILEKPMQPTVIESQHPREKQAIDICTMICRIDCSIRGQKFGN